MAKYGFLREKAFDVIMWMDGPAGKPNQAVHVIWAGEKVKPEYTAPAPDPDQSHSTAELS